MAFLLAFAGGALLAALTIDFIAPGVDRGHFAHLGLGAMLGGFLFTRLESVLGGVRRAQPLGNLSADVEDKMLSIMLVREISAGACLYRADDPAINLYSFAAEKPKEPRITIDDKNKKLII